MDDPTTSNLKGSPSPEQDGQILIMSPGTDIVPPAGSNRTGWAVEDEDAKDDLNKMGAENALHNACFHDVLLRTRSNLSALDLSTIMEGDEGGDETAEDDLPVSQQIINKAMDQAFDDLDLNKTGTLERFELVLLLQSAATTIQLDVEPAVIDACVEALLEDVHANSGSSTSDLASSSDREVVNKEQFRDIFRRNPDVLRLFEDPKALTDDAVTHRIRRGKRFWQKQKSLLFWLCLYVAANIVAFTIKAVKYANNEDAMAVFGNCIIVARGAAQCLNLNTALILLPMARHVWTRVRATRARVYFPFMDALQEMHILVGCVLALWVTTHVSAHICDFYRLAHVAEADDIVALFGNKLGEVIPSSASERWVMLLQHRAAITGIIMLGCMLFAYPLTLWRRSHYNTFWTSHHLLLIMLAALSFHGTGNLLQPFQSVYWILPSLTVYLFNERNILKSPLCRQEAHFFLGWYLE